MTIFEMTFVGMAVSGFCQIVANIVRAPKKERGLHVLLGAIDLAFALALGCLIFWFAKYAA